MWLRDAKSAMTRGVPLCCISLHMPCSLDFSNFLEYIQSSASLGISGVSTKQHEA